MLYEPWIDNVAHVYLSVYSLDDSYQAIDVDDV